MPTDIIFGERVFTGADAKAAGAALWLSGGDLKRVSGWEHKPQGFCKGDVCVPVPAFNAWCFGEAASERKRSLTSLDAPDFALPDLEGKMHSLTEHRGKKVLVVSWASW